MQEHHEFKSTKTNHPNLNILFIFSPLLLTLDTDFTQKNTVFFKEYCSVL